MATTSCAIDDCDDLDCWMFFAKSFGNDFKCQNRSDCNQSSAQPSLHAGHQGRGKVPNPLFADVKKISGSSEIQPEGTLHSSSQRTPSVCSSSHASDAVVSVYVIVDPANPGTFLLPSQSVKVGESEWKCATAFLDSSLLPLEHRPRQNTAVTTRTTKRDSDDFVPPAKPARISSSKTNVLRHPHNTTGLHTLTSQVQYVCRDSKPAIHESPSIQTKCCSSNTPATTNLPHLGTTSNHRTCLIHPRLRTGVPRKIQKEKSTVLKPLTAYNFFYRDERDSIVNYTKGNGRNHNHTSDLGQAEQPLPPAQLPPPCQDWSVDHQQHLLHERWVVDPVRQTRKRRHRKVHPSSSWSFSDLSKVISSRWRNLPDQGKLFYRTLAQLDWRRHQHEMLALTAAPQQQSGRGKSAGIVETTLSVVG